MVSLLGLAALELQVKSLGFGFRAFGVGFGLQSFGLSSLELEGKGLGFGLRTYVDP